MFACLVWIYGFAFIDVIILVYNTTTPHISNTSWVQIKILTDKKIIFIQEKINFKSRIIAIKFVFDFYLSDP